MSHNHCAQKALDAKSQEKKKIKKERENENRYRGKECCLSGFAISGSIVDANNLKTLSFHSITDA